MAKPEYQSGSESKILQNMLIKLKDTVVWTCYRISLKAQRIRILKTVSQCRGHKNNLHGYPVRKKHIRGIRKAVEEHKIQTTQYLLWVERIRFSSSYGT
jgi:hypothetical protein